LIRLLLDGRKLNEIRVSEVMGEPLPVVSESATAEELLRLYAGGKPAVLVRRTSGNWGILTKADLVAAL
jgi:predicted transcriptional regulator